jgi:UDP-N-acetylmuramoylalanine--D-glutamate ligase
MKLVVGLGITGQSVLKYFSKKHVQHIAFDTRKSLKGLPALKAKYPTLRVYLGALPDECWESIDEIVVSPGVPLEIDVIVTAKKKNIPVVGDIELFVRECTKPIIAITGTNGKSTVTSLVGEILQSAGLNVGVCGNIGTPVLDTLEDSIDAWVFELSSFQLDTVYSLAADIAVCLNITPDHLDRHGSFDAYVRSKHRVYRNAKTLVYNLDDKLTHPKALAKSVSVSNTANDADYHLLSKEGRPWLGQGKKPFFPVKDLKIIGNHNVFNALTSCAVASSYGVPVKAIVEALKRFTGLKHRCEWIAEEQGVLWINDSKGTNVGAATAAIESFGKTIKGKVILVAGGIAKDADFTPLKKPVSAYVREVILIGRDKGLIENALTDSCRVLTVESLEDAVIKAKNAALFNDCVLFSPACASFDMFRNFSDRGDRFVGMVKRLLSGGTLS